MFHPNCLPFPIVYTVQLYFSLPLSVISHCPSVPIDYPSPLFFSLPFHVHHLPKFFIHHCLYSPVYHFPLSLICHSQLSIISSCLLSPIVCHSHCIMYVFWHCLHFPIVYFPIVCNSHCILFTNVSCPIVCHSPLSVIPLQCIWVVMSICSTTTLLWCYSAARLQSYVISKCIGK